MDLNPTLCGPEHVAQRRRVSNRLDDLDLIRGAGDSQAAERGADCDDRPSVLDAEHELPDPLVVVGENSSGEREDLRRGAIEPRRALRAGCLLVGRG
jgi:hypothetical protein